MSRQVLKTGIFTPFPMHLGGGERYLLTMAKELSRLGPVEFLSSTPLRSQEIARSFGLDCGGVTFLPLGRTIPGYRPYDLYITQSNLPYPPSFSRGRKALCVIQFPFPPPVESTLARTRRSLEGTAKLASFDGVIVYSEFARQWTVRRIPVDRPVAILAPPCAVTGRRTGPKENMLISVGRFIATGHVKKQFEMMRAFGKLVALGITGWSYHSIGGIRADPSIQAYLGRVREAAAGLPAAIEIDLADVDVEDRYARARLFWHATGMGEDPSAHPERMEHFGMSTVEAMACGAVPLVINRGGQPEIVEPGKNGFVWETEDELVEQTARLMRNPELLEPLSAAAIERAAAYSVERFRENLMAVLESFGVPS